MNTTPAKPAKPDTATPTGENPGTKVAVIFDLLPAFQNAALADSLTHLGFASILPLLALSGGIESSLRNCGILIDKPATAGNCLDGVIEFATSDRVHAVELVHQICVAAIIDGYCCVTWFDAAEGAWRMAHGVLFSGLTVEHLLSVERKQRRIDWSRQHAEEGARLRELFPHPPQQNPPTDLPPA